MLKTLRTKTRVVATNDPYIASVSDMVVVLADGAIVERGPYKQLADKKDSLCSKLIAEKEKEKERRRNREESLQKEDEIRKESWVMLQRTSSSPSPSDADRMMNGSEAEDDEASLVAAEADVDEERYDGFLVDVNVIGVVGGVTFVSVLLFLFTEVHTRLSSYRLEF